jgi:hypothetical protein
VLDPAISREVLGEFFLSYTGRTTLPVEQHRPARGGTLVDGENTIGGRHVIRPSNDASPQ